MKRLKHSTGAVTAALGCALLLAACQNRARMNDEKMFAGTHWRLAEIGGRKAITDSSAREAFIEFDSAKGSIGGSSGCNRFGGAYMREGERLTITQIISTKMACLDNGVMEQEAALIAALYRTSHWKIAGDQLKLYDSTGAAVVQFERGAR